MKIGDKVYQYDNSGRIYESTITKRIYYTEDGLCFDDSAIGESIFTSEAKAKKVFTEVNND